MRFLLISNGAIGISECCTVDTYVLLYQQEIAVPDVDDWLHGLKPHEKDRNCAV